jgi:hypothetical protein
MFAPGLTLAYRPDLGLVIARWQREVTPTELQSGYLAIRATADEAQCSQWLLDLRRREDVIEPAVNAPLRAQQPGTAMVSAADADCQLATFIDEAQAYQWLAR